MTDWAGFWLGLGIFLGLACVGQGLAFIARAIVIKEHGEEIFNG
jgi:hypothetical protein